MYKLSYYNFVIPVPEKSVYLLMNTLTGSMVEIEKMHAECLDKWRILLRTEKAIPPEELAVLTDAELDILKDNGVLIGADVNEEDIISARMQREQEHVYKNATFALTICPTMSCNMGCSYCFEGEKPVKSQMSDKTIEDIISFIDREYKNREFVDRFSSIHVTWFGGEPLLKPAIVEKLSHKLIAKAEEFDIKYSAGVITNGTALTKDVWQCLENSRISMAQLTLDGYREQHNELRPILPMYGENTNESNYDLILNNLQNRPDSIGASIRVNMDKRISENLGLMLDDLEERGIWPQQRDKVTVYLAHKHAPLVRAGTNVTVDTTGFLTKREFLKEREDFRMLLLERYNEWAKKNGREVGKLKFEIPKPVESFMCTAANQPYSITLDPEGYIHQCWEQPNEPETRSQHISEKYVLDHPLKKPFLEWNKLKDYDMCKKCKLLPVCEGTCTVQEPPMLCCDWRWSLKSKMKSQYLKSLDQPELIQPLEDVVAA